MASVYQRVFQSVSKWPRKTWTDKQTNKHFRIYISRDFISWGRGVLHGYLNRRKCWIKAKRLCWIPVLPTTVLKNTNEEKTAVNITWNLNNAAIMTQKVTELYDGSLWVVFRLSRWVLNTSESISNESIMWK